LSEETDAIAIIVSEETGGISIAHNDHLDKGLEIDEFEEIIRNLLGTREIEEDEESV